MIVGLGIDLVSIHRIRAIWERHGQRFAERILTVDELRQFGQTRHPERFLAKRFAAKEAFAKAMGTGMRGPLQWQAVGTGHDAWGAPQLVLDEAVLQPLLRARHVERSWLTLSDEQEHAMACVVLESA